MNGNDLGILLMWRDRWDPQQYEIALIKSGEAHVVGGLLEIS